jgi:hypothetical protein
VWLALFAMLVPEHPRVPLAKQWITKLEAPEAVSNTQQFQEAWHFIEGLSFPPK